MFQLPRIGTKKLICSERTLKMLGKFVKVTFWLSAIRNKALTIKFFQF